MSEAGGLPIADRASVFTLEVSSNKELDRLLRETPMWGYWPDYRNDMPPRPSVVAIYRDDGGKIGA